MAMMDRWPRIQLIVHFNLHDLLKNLVVGQAAFRNWIPSWFDEKAKKLVRRYPTTIKMVEVIRSKMDLADKDDVVRWTAVVTGFLFLVRGG